MAPKLDPRADRIKRGEDIAKKLYDPTKQYLPPNFRDTLLQNHTPLAKKYGSPIGIFRRVDHRILYAPPPAAKRSGLTPTASPTLTKPRYYIPPVQGSSSPGPSKRPLDPNDSGTETLPPPKRQRRASDPGNDDPDTDTPNANSAVPSSSIPSTLPPDARRRMKEKIDILQTRRLYGFTSNELRDLGAFDPYVEDDETAGRKRQGVIHPVFERRNWATEDQMPKNIGAIPLLGGREGFWLALDPFVWELVLPSAVLASAILNDERQFGWWDTLINGRREELGTVQGSGQTYLRLHPRTADKWTKDDNIAEMRNLFRNAAGKIQFNLISGYTNRPSRLPSWLDTTGHGVTSTLLEQDTIQVRMSIEWIQGLLQVGLTEAEKRSISWHFAMTLVHELAHAVARMIKMTRGISLNENEAFMGDEPLAEEGYSLITHIFGGTTEPLIHNCYQRGGPGLAHGGTIKSDWFVHSHSEYGTSATRKNPPPQVKPVAAGETDPYYTRDYYPVPATFVARLYHDDFWTVLKGYDREATFMGPFVYGHRYTSIEPITDQNQPPTAASPYRANKFWTKHTIRGDMTKAERDAATIEHQRIRHAAKVQNVLPQDPSSIAPKVDENDLEPGPPADDINYKTPDQAYDMIKNYLIKNRGWEHLAFDTMDIVTEPQLFRYIRDHNRRQLPADKNVLTITAQQLRAFLCSAHRKEELFKWRIYNGNGAVKRRDEGWPPATPLAVPSLNQQTRLLVQGLEMRFNSTTNGLRQGMFDRLGEARDVDLDVFLKWVRTLQPDFFNVPMFAGDQGSKTLQRLLNCMMFFGSKNLTVGPKGILRFKYDITDMLKKKGERPIFPTT